MSEIWLPVNSAVEILREHHQKTVTAAAIRKAVREHRVKISYPPRTHRRPGRPAYDVWFPDVLAMPGKPGHPGGSTERHATAARANGRKGGRGHKRVPTRPNPDQE